MLSMKTTTAVSIVLVLQMTMTVGVSLALYKSCLYECLHCVNTWGKELFNGEACAKRCFDTEGNSIDKTCTDSFNRSSRRVSAASKKYLHSNNLSQVLLKSFSNGYSNGYRGSQGYKTKHVAAIPSESRLTSPLFTECQHLCRSCEALFTANMDAHYCLYTCARTQKKVVAC